MPTMMASIVDDEDAKTTNSTMATRTEENDKDTVLFGSMNADIANALANHIDAAIAQGVESQPLLQATRSPSRDYDITIVHAHCRCH